MSASLELSEGVCGVALTVIAAALEESYVHLLLVLNQNEHLRPDERGECDDESVHSLAHCWEALFHCWLDCLSGVHAKCEETLGSAHPFPHEEGTLRVLNGEALKMADAPSGLDVYAHGFELLRRLYFSRLDAPLGTSEGRG